MGFMDKIKKITGVDGYDDNNYEDDGYYDDVIGGGYESDADAQNSQRSMWAAAIPCRQTTSTAAATISSSPSRRLPL